MSLAYWQTMVAGSLDPHANHHSRTGRIEEVKRAAAGPTPSGIALRDAEYHLERAAECMRAAVAAEPCLAVKLGTVHAQLQALQALLLERTRGVTNG